MKDKTNKKGNLRLRNGFPSNYHIEAVISILDEVGSWQIMLERIYNSHYGNGVPAMFIS